MPGYHSGINILGAGVEVTKVTLCASFCGKSLSRPSLCNLDSTPPQVINAAANDGEPCSGGQSPTSHDFAPIHRGLPELSAPFCNRREFETRSQQKSRSFPFGGRSWRAGHSENRAHGECFFGEELVPL